MTREQFIYEVKACQEPLRRFLTTLCEGDTAKADDLAQDAFVKAYTSLESYGGRSKFSTWVFRIAYNCFIDERRRIEARGGRGEDLSSRLISSAPADDPSAHFRYQSLYRAIEKLNDHERSAIILFYMEDMPTKEIADILEVGDGTVRTWLARGREHLRNNLRHE